MNMPRKQGLRRCLHGLMVAFSLAASTASAGGLESLQFFLKEVRTFRAGFEQTILTKNGRTAQVSKGVMAFQRPGKFRWQVEQPHPQLVVGDGQRIWLYDPDLQQVTRRQQGAALGATPAALLAGQQGLERFFTLQERDAQEGLFWVEAMPKSGDGGFVNIRLGFTANHQLQQMEMLDSFGQTTRIRFVRAEQNVSIPAEQFRFVPPAGVDVLGD